MSLGYSQIPEIDFADNFAPAVHDITFRIVLLLWTVKDGHVTIVDVERALLDRELEEEIYMKIPSGLIEYGEGLKPEEDCLELKHSIYGLIQAARQWWK